MNNKIEVFEIETDKLVAGDHGEFVTIDSLREKMIEKIDISDSAKYYIVEKDTTDQDNIDNIRMQRRVEYEKRNLTFDLFEGP